METARLPVPAARFRALAEVPLRRVVEEVLAASGRTLLGVGEGFLSGYDDMVRARLADEGVGVLPREDRAVLTLVLLFSVAAPRAGGSVLPQALWTQGVPVNRERLKQSAVPDRVVDAALSRLAAADLVRTTGSGIVLGSQLLRLTPAAQADLFEQLVLLAEPHGVMAESIWRRRARVASQEGQER
ncbi:hypothetical protein OHA09_36010 [Streptomyces longwoodensis]|uniref:hypothetical protein n=1 Tax=Streptomyces longwoodensis TaxID=68231 RepID=UPI002E810DD8|nr:hypothetical protein [Streptomyces longwoodensis]WUC55760.1 hypothetical protein OHA09_00965 [Streptomyces longwoodensis]WUC62121.1 hypothetical protein OHA09_36010 [Streptomyces longwoodensis]